MELKKYQQSALADLATYMKQLSVDCDLRKAYRNFWLQKGIDVDAVAPNQFLRPYDNTICGVPRVMFKVPTAGGKTFIACNALKVIFDHLPANRHKVVAWFVPSDSILRQTYRNLSDPSHPYCLRIKSHFNNRVVVVDKATALSGTGIQPSQIAEQLTIFVLSVQSFATKEKDKRLAFQENSSLAAYANAFDADNKIDGADETSLIQAIAHLNPVVIIDESHNFEAKLRIELFKQINPSFILDLTATPREKSNIISFVDAKKLKDANMVKLPVVLYNRDSVSEVLFNAISLRRSLEKMAVEMHQKGGRYIRPIVLVQAQPKSGNGTETFDRVKEKLVSAGIAEEHIKIKTAEKDEIKNIDLMAEDCPVRYIITVNALKEGWDCPFAYILASLANKTSRIDVEQIVGRILRLPYTTKHSVEFLNISYVFTSSNNFRKTVDSVIRGLNNAGFSSKDTRFVVPIDEPESQYTPTAEQGSLFPGHENSTTPSDTDSQTDSDADKANEDDNNFAHEVLKSQLKEEVAKAPQSNAPDSSAEKVDAPSTTTIILSQAHEANDNYEHNNDFETDTSVPTEMKDVIKSYGIKDGFQEIAKSLRLPVFLMKTQKTEMFNPTGLVKLTKSQLTEGFELDKADKNINFTGPEQDAVYIDLEKKTEDQFVPKQFKMNDKQLHAFRETFVSYDVEKKLEQLTGKIASRLRFDEVNELHISNYIKSVLSGKSSEELVSLFDNDLLTENAFKQKINSLIVAYQYKHFKELMDKTHIICSAECDEAYKFPAEISPAKVAISLSKGLYNEEDGDINNFEYNIISSVANQENVLFWHRNHERGDGFCINGFINHYPDFIIYTQSGNVVMLETKGDDRDNSDIGTK